MSKFVAILISLMLFTCSSFGQVDSIKRVKYKKGFHFEEGFYITNEDFKNNNPIPKSRIKTTYNCSSLSFFKDVRRLDELEYYDNNNDLHKVTWNEVWGYSDGLNIHYRGMKIRIIGAICHLTYFSPRYSSENNYLVPENAREYMIDFEYGTIHEFKKKYLKIILMRDKELYQKFEETRAFTKVKKKMRLYEFLNLYNKKHPIYFPVD